MRRAAIFTGFLAAVACSPAPGPVPIVTAPLASSSTTSDMAAPDAGAPAPPMKPAPLVVAMVVDQLSAWVAATRWPELPQAGGFARLRREGTWAKSMRHAHAVTDTGPGHAALHTGKPAGESGIFDNEIPNPSGGSNLSIMRDESTRIVTAAGVQAAAGASAKPLRVPTVGDRLRDAWPDSNVISVSLKDRGAILPAGHRPTRIFWFDAGADGFVTSTAFAQELPSWAEKIAGHDAVVAARAKPWTLLDEAWVKAHAATRDDAPGEGDLEGFGLTFPHTAKTPRGFRALPATDAMIARLGLAALEAERKPHPDEPTLLLLSFSASDVIGHTFGPDSWEAWEHIRELDATLAELFGALDAYGEWSAVLAADHGNVSMPEAIAAGAVPPSCKGAKDAPIVAPNDPWERPCRPGKRILPSAVLKELRAKVGAAVAGVADPWIFMSGEPSPDVDKKARAVFAAHPEIGYVYSTSDLQAKCPDVRAKMRPAPDRARADEDVMSLVCRAFPYPPQTPPWGYYVIPKRPSFWDGGSVEDKGTSHGTPYLYDRTVPLLVRGKGVEAGAVIDDPVDFTAYSALEASFLGLDERTPAEILTRLRASGPASASSTGR